MVSFLIPYRDIHTCELAQTYHCTQCERSFNREYNLKNHVKNVHGEKIFNCQHCTKTFGTARRMKDHTIAYHEPVYCHICNKKLRDKWEFKKHEVLVHKKMSKNVHICDICPAMHNVFFSERTYLKHCEKKHSGSADIGEDSD